MSVIADYANLYETEFRPRRKRLRYLGVLVIWVGLFLVRPRLALTIWREKGRAGISGDTILICPLRHSKSQGGHRI